MKYPTDVDYFDHWTDEMAYILGFLTADGYVTKNGVYFDLAENDVEILEFIRSKISPARPIPRYVKNDKKRNRITSYRRLSLTSKQLSQSVISHGILPKKTGKEIIPEMDERFVSHFIRGVFDGDGSVVIRKRGTHEVSIKSASQSFLYKIKEACGGIGCKPFLQRDKRSRKPFYAYSIGLQESRQFRDFIYPNKTDFGLRRKRVRLARF